MSNDDREPAKKRITLIVHGLGGGGAERVASLLVNWLYTYGYAVNVLAAYSPVQNYHIEEGITCRYIGQSNGNGVISGIIRVIKAYRFLRKSNTDVMISFIAKEFSVLSRSKKYRKIYSIRTDPSTLMKGSRILTKFYDFFFGYADHMVFQTKEAQEFFNRGIQEKSTVIYNPLSSDLYAWCDSKHEDIIMTACRLEPQKNLKLLIDAFSIFINEHPNYILNIFGEGAQLNELIQHAQTRGVAEKVHFCGRSNEIFKEYARSRMFVLSSDYEGLSNSMLEALASGTPTVCTDCSNGGAKQFVRNGENGFITPVGDSEQLAKAMSVLADDPQLQESFSKNSVMIKDILNVDRICNQWNELLK